MGCNAYKAPVLSKNGSGRFKYCFDLLNYKLVESGFEKEDAASSCVDHFSTGPIVDLDESTRTGTTTHAVGSVALGAFYGQPTRI